MLEQPQQGQFTGRRGAAGLLLGEPVQGAADAAALRLQIGQEGASLVTAGLGLDDYRHAAAASRIGWVSGEVPR